MAELIDVRLKRAALALATTLDYALAAELLDLSETELRVQIGSLEDRLYVRLFQLDCKKPVLTDEGRYLIQAMREALSRAGQAPSEKDAEPK